MAWLTLACGDRVGQLVDADLAGGQRGGIGLDAHGIFGRAEHADLGHAVDGGKLARQQGLGIFVQLPSGLIVSERHRDEHDRDVGRVLTLRKVGGCGSALGRLARGGGNRRLHVLGGGVDVAVQVNCRVMLVEPWLLVTRSSGRCRGWWRTGSPAARPRAEAMVSGSAPGRLALT